ncbi:MAG: ABC transporter permease [Planctomycetes bacterium]|jgi:phospholipid/cholesterol/gamma-HCH transport system permease protein|nr:ABC transporter permease [Planctomycetota bacterium]
MSIATATRGRTQGGALSVSLEGRLDVRTTGRVWRETEELIDKEPLAPLVLDVSKLKYLDGAGVALLMHLQLRQERAGLHFDIVGLTLEHARLFELYESGAKKELPPEPPPRSGVEQIGRYGVAFLADLAEMTRFVGELASALANAIRHPRTVRWRETLRAAESCGADAVPIVALIVFLIGAILAYQGAIALQKFGAEIFVADLVALSLVREIGPLMTAIVLTGRSGSAFAAEIGTMKVREEIDALSTMGLSPTRFLVIPRVLAAVWTTPLLVVLANFCGLIGGAVVYLSLGFSMTSYVNQVSSTIDLSDFLGGLFKAFCFGIVVAAIGCIRGLQTGSGASAVGISTTRAVVTGITLIVIGDGIFSVAFYYLGI